MGAAESERLSGLRILHIMSMQPKAPGRAPFFRHVCLPRPRLFSLLAGLAISCGATTAIAEPLAWTGSLAAGARYSELQEMNVAGNRIVREHGWLPGLDGVLATSIGAASLDIEAQYHDGVITYDGQSQFGQPLRSSTRQRFATLGVAGAYPVAATLDVTAAIEQQLAAREIRGVGAIAGLTEHTSTTAMIIGLRKKFVFDGAESAGAACGCNLQVGAALVLAKPEHLRVNFAQDFDEVSLRTRSSTGVRLTARLTPMTTPWYVALHADRMHVASSDMFDLRSMGTIVGSLVQPAHDITSVTISAGYRF
jgi:hypothetical protein